MNSSGPTWPERRQAERLQRNRLRFAHVGSLLAVAVLTSCWVLPEAVAQENDPNECDQPGEEPDVLLWDIHQAMRHGTVGEISAYSIGTTSCNVGDCWLEWDRHTNRHPVIGQNMYRLKDGRLEQIGQSWLKHGFFALSQDICSTDCVATDGNHLGVNCSDPYNADFNGLQQRLGPKSEVDPTTGEFVYPFTGIDEVGDAIYKRLQVHNADLDPALNAGAEYWVEGQYVAADDAAAGNDANNVAHRKIIVTGSGGFFNIFLSSSDPTRSGSALEAWSASQAGVDRADVMVPGDGRYIAGAAVEDLEDGFYRYEYAVQNLTSVRAAGEFRVPLPFDAEVRAVGFHDVDYHSGEPYDGTDWSVAAGSGALSFSTTPHSTDPQANALRWGTLYNFRFETDAPPVQGVAELGLFAPGTPAEVSFGILVPRICDGDGVCAPGENPCNCGTDCGVPAAVEATCDDAIDEDCDGLIDCADHDCCGDQACDDGEDLDEDGVAGCDCDDAEASVWAVPGVARNVTLSHTPLGNTTISWDAPEFPGGTLPVYDVIRSPEASEFLVGSSCTGQNQLLTSSVEPDLPPPGGLFYFLVRGENGCPSGMGALGEDSSGRARVARSCP